MSNLKKFYLRFAEYVIYAPLSALWVFGYFIFAIIQLVSFPIVGLKRAQSILIAYDLAHSKFEEKFEEEYEKTIDGDSEREDEATVITTRKGGQANPKDEHENV